MGMTLRILPIFLILLLFAWGCDDEIIDGDGESITSITMKITFVDKDGNTPQTEIERQGPVNVKMLTDIRGVGVFESGRLIYPDWTFTTGTIDLSIKQSGERRLELYVDFPENFEQYVKDSNIQLHYIVEDYIVTECDGTFNGIPGEADLQGRAGTFLKFKVPIEE